ncbi:hypothetical protein [Chitinophaga sp. S165]|uniref:hypothetical protein n=1 Tax=Chitinophaga sp. S165 TaxID=2135462 RepID=UPI000D997079|nr:hypothetical protein [Chitinophaga sp. S165]PWV56825.1 hypothetical protein C7475_1011343 [Chitinophaga sp. S165]
MKFAFISFLTLISLVITSCGQPHTDRTIEKVKSASKDNATSIRSYTGYHTMYEYTDSSGNSLVIKNSFPKGELYTGPNGEKYVKAIFWTQVTNNADVPLELSINFSGNTYDFLDSTGSSVVRSYKLLVPPDTMTLGKESLLNFGLTNIDDFVRKSIDKPTSLRRTINPKESSGVYLIRLAIMQKADSLQVKTKARGGGVTRAGFSLKGQNLIYTLNGKEFPGGNINLKYLTLKDHRKVGI